MLTQAVDDYLAVRRAAGFKLKTTERYLRYFVHFARARGDTHVRGTSAIDWAAQASTEVERHHRYQRVIHFARFMHAEEPRHEIPPEHVFCGHPHARHPICSQKTSCTGSFVPPVVWGHQAHCDRAPTRPCSRCSPSPDSDRQKPTHCAAMTLPTTD